MRRSMAARLSRRNDVIIALCLPFSSCGNAAIDSVDDHVGVAAPNGPFLAAVRLLVHGRWLDCAAPRSKLANPSRFPCAALLSTLQTSWACKSLHHL